MLSFSHNNYVKQIAALDKLPTDPAIYTKWIQAGAHLDFLRHNAASDEIVIYASGEYSFIHSLVVPNKILFPLDHDDLLRWSHNPYDARAASYAYGGGSDLMRVEKDHPREQIMSLLHKWDRSEIWWWKSRDQGLFNRANPPLTESRDEWANAFLDLSQLVIEGFETRPIRKQLDKLGISYDHAKDQSLTLIEKLISQLASPPSPVTLHGLREVQRIRSKVKGHAGSSEGKQITNDAITHHDSFGSHFQHICETVALELESIDTVCGKLS